MGVSNPLDDRAEQNRGYAEVPLSTVNPRVGNAHLKQNSILESYKIAQGFNETVTSRVLLLEVTRGTVVRLNKINLSVSENFSARKVFSGLD